MAELDSTRYAPDTSVSNTFNDALGTVSDLNLFALAREPCATWPRHTLWRPSSLDFQLRRRALAQATLFPSVLNFASCTSTATAALTSNFPFRTPEVGRALQFPAKIIAVLVSGARSEAHQGSLTLYQHITDNPSTLVEILPFPKPKLYTRTRV